VFVFLSYVFFVFELEARSTGQTDKQTGRQTRRVMRPISTFYYENKAAKIEIPTAKGGTAVQGRPRSSILVLMESL